MTAQRAICFAASSLALIFATGCVHRELLGFDDHASKPLTAMRVQTSTSYWLWNSHEYVFYSCAEQGDKLTCKRLCGGGADVVCPMVVENGNRASTNIR